MLENVKAKSADKLLDALNDTGCSLARNFSAENHHPIFCQGGRARSAQQ